MPERIEAYLETAAEQIRWKRARPVLTAELRTHLLDQRDACLAEGLEEQEAQEEALRQMGDPVSVGAELDRVHRPKPQWGLLGLTLVLVLTGGFLRVWLTAGSMEYDAANPVRTALSLLLGCGCLLAGYFLDCSFLGRHGKAVYLAALLGGILCLWWSPVWNGASYYTRHMVLVYPAVYAAWVYAWRGKGRRGLLAAMLGIVPLAAVCLWAPYLLGLLLLLAAGLAVLGVSARTDWFGVGRRSGTLAVGGAALALGGGIGWAVTRGFLHTRLLLALHPELDPLGAGYQAIAVRTAISGARWLGEGSTEPYTRHTYEQTVPAWGSDFLLTTVAHKLGWLPLLALLTVCAALFGWLLFRCLRQKNQLGRLLSLAVVTALGFQAVFSLFLNLGVVLFSAHFPLLMGNLHTMVDMALIGLTLSAFRQETIPTVHPAGSKTPKNRRPLISWKDGDLVIALGRRG